MEMGLFGVIVKDGRDLMTAANNMDMGHRGVEKGAEALENAWRRMDHRQHNLPGHRQLRQGDDNGSRRKQNVIEERVPRSVPDKSLGQINVH